MIRVGLGVLCDKVVGWCGVYIVVVIWVVCVMGYGLWNLMVIVCKLLEKCWLSVLCRLFCFLFEELLRYE